MSHCTAIHSMLITRTHEIQFWVKDIVSNKCQFAQINEHAIENISLWIWWLNQLIYIHRFYVYSRDASNQNRVDKRCWLRKKIEISYLACSIRWDFIAKTASNHFQITITMEKSKMTWFWTALAAVLILLFISVRFNLNVSLIRFYSESIFSL